MFLRLAPGVQSSVHDKGIPVVLVPAQRPGHVPSAIAGATTTEVTTRVDLVKAGRAGPSAMCNAGQMLGAVGGASGLPATEDAGQGGGSGGIRAAADDGRPDHPKPLQTPVPATGDAGNASNRRAVHPHGG